MTSVSLPLGVSFSHRLKLGTVSRRVAEQFHERHHSYMPYLDRVCIVHHGGYLGSELVGVVTYAMPRRSAPIRSVERHKMGEVARVTIALDMDNLASCLMAKSQDKFRREHGSRLGIELLLTFVHSEYQGSMFRALGGKGWEYDGPAKTAESGNRDNREIQRTEKSRWVCAFDVDTPDQTTFADVPNTAALADGGFIPGDEL